MANRSVLVVGGCGLVGFHVVKALREDGAWPDIHVMSRNPNSNRLDGVSYHACDLTSPTAVERLVAEIKPEVIIHTASPVSAGNSGNEKSFMDVNVTGTKNILDSAISGDGAVRAFLFTGSVSSHDGSSFVNATEDFPLMSEHTRTSNYYSKSKAIADRYVQAANGRGGVKTIVLRLVTVYGERDNQMIPGTLAILRDGRQRNQIGDNTAPFDFVSCENAASAHVYAAHALTGRLETPAPGKIDGEAFFITDGDPIPFWTMARKIWAAAGDQTPASQIKVIPSWFMLNLASAVEWLYWIFTLGRKRPASLRRHNMEYVTQTRTFSIDKARTQLGWQPAANRDRNVKEGVEWALKHAFAKEAKPKEQ